MLSSMLSSAKSTTPSERARLLPGGPTVRHDYAYRRPRYLAPDTSLEDEEENISYTGVHEPNEDGDEDEDDGGDDEGEEAVEEEEEEEEEVEEELEEMDESHRSDENPDEPLLPIFSAPHLDRLPVYKITHAIRILIMQRCETTLSWDQLRSPQVSQFLVKPVQQIITAKHFSRATMYALMANCLQFHKEGQMNPGNVGVSRTRAIMAELLAIRLLKDYSTRELIDALSYDFDPLQGMTDPSGVHTMPGTMTPRSQIRASRTSTIEVAIRAQAKKFVAHPLVVQQLEAIWAGTIVFHSAADQLHRSPIYNAIHAFYPGTSGYGTISGQGGKNSGQFLTVNSSEGKTSEQSGTVVRRAVTIYNPRDASLFKLSRLRVPRYRQLFSTVSFAIMLALFLAVLVQRSVQISPLEVFFWLWSAGFMLDEIVGFSEQGFGLYIMSVWNVFDLGILLLFILYYLLRLYGLLMTEFDKASTANMAYDILASTAVLLFPRLFSVLDHYKYFSQLLIAFRMMAMDLLAILLLIVIACSGFFVAFTVSFTKENQDAGNVAYGLFQILMGYTPAAWEKWDDYNALGRVTLTLFLFIAHFLIVTILITVLTNSFMMIVQNANEEHQFLFAVNTLSMVKSEALFSYIAPTNTLGWVLSPLRFFIPFRQYLKLNRTVIKFTHFPILFLIFAYERLILSRLSYDLTELVEQREKPRKKARELGFQNTGTIFSPNRRLREPSITTLRKDRALDEVFRRPVRVPSSRARPPKNKSKTVVDSWMQRMGNEGGASPPMEEPRSVLEALEERRPNMRRPVVIRRSGYIGREVSVATRSIKSDPEVMSITPARPRPIQEESEGMELSDVMRPQGTDDDGDDELVSTDIEHGTLGGMDDGPSGDSGKENRKTQMSQQARDLFLSTPTTRRPPPQNTRQPGIRTPKATRTPPRSQQAFAPNPEANAHGRNISTNTILYKPRPTLSTNIPTKPPHPPRHSTPSASPKRRNPLPRSAPLSGAMTPATNPPGAGGRRTPKRAAQPPAAGFRDIAALGLGLAPVPALRTAGLGPGPGAGAGPISLRARALDLASDLGDNGPRPGAEAGHLLGTSFNTALAEGFLGRAAATAVGPRGERERGRRRARGAPPPPPPPPAEEQGGGVVGRIMLNRMRELEEGFKDVVREVRGMKRESPVEGPGSGVMGSSVEGSVVGAAARAGPMDVGAKMERERSSGLAAAAVAAAKTEDRGALDGAGDERGAS